MENASPLWHDVINSVSRTRPNLFDHATSELSQDAFLCWMFAWADPTFKNEEPCLNKMAQRFVQHCLKLPNLPEIDIGKVTIKRQYHKIDILVTINDKYALIVEDKAGTVEHSGQLEKYSNALSDHEPKLEQVPIYVQSGEQESYANVERAGYQVVRRGDLLELLASALAEGCSSAILQDFHVHLSAIESDVQAYKVAPLESWNGRAWQGFYGELQKRMKQGNWSYVSNPAGGFYGFWWGVQEDGSSTQYLQLEQGRLCFRISVSNSDERQQLKHEWHRRILEAGRQTDLQLVKPSRLRSGKTMAVARLSGDYRATTDGKLDMNKTLAVLEAAEKVLGTARAHV